MGTKTVGLAMLAIVTMASIGCAGSARVVRRGSFSGELALSGAVYPSMEAARTEMLEHCGGRVRILEGAEASALAAADPGIAKADASAQTIDGERLHYVCVARAERAR